MSTPHRPPARESDQIDVIRNDDEKTITFVADRDEDRPGAPTEWITIADEDVVDVEASR
jgi:hypothetical protein